MNWWNLSGINNGLEKVKAIHYKSYAMLFLSSGLYRRYRNLTGSAKRFADLHRMPPVITAGVDLHHALKQIKLLLAAERRLIRSRGMRSLLRKRAPFS